MGSSVSFEDRPGFMIGAWGWKFFESDHDYDIVAHLGADMGICKYNPSEYYMCYQAQVPTDSLDPQMRDSLLNPNDPAFVIKHLQENRELEKVFKKYYGMLEDYKIIDIKAVRAKGEMIDSPRYYIFLLGLLAMQLGCTLSRKHRRWMKTNWNACLFMYERIDQAKMAVFGYENGKPLKLSSKTLDQKMMTCLGKNERYVKCSPSQGLNVPNNAVIISTMRMYLDNEAAKAKGATSNKGANISNVFATGDGVAGLNQTAAEQAALEAAKASIVKEDKAAEINEALDPPSGVTIKQWCSNQAARDRLNEHGKFSAPVEELNDEDMVKFMMGLLKNGGLK
ncbi:hypothetical protein N0V90_004995 [Kalmusia sp. IMI 367209]|nr:hypothetical protein N0V90_004995 [Kalmusia sp. IMI 367209]